MPITKEAVAELLSTSSRTLTRRLCKEENCQFSTLLRDVRLEKAKQTLEDGHADVQQLAIDLVSLTDVVLSAPLNNGR